MFIAPASLREGTKRMRPCRAMASRIGMLWIEITPKTVVTPISASACAITSPAGSAIATTSGCRAVATGVIFVVPSYVARDAARNLERSAGNETRGRRAQERDSARHLLGLTKPLHRDMP